MDLKQGFYQIEMDPESAPFTAFSAPVGRNGQQHLQYKRMGMGLKEAPITFSKAISLAMAGLQPTSLLNQRNANSLNARLKF